MYVWACLVSKLKTVSIKCAFTLLHVVPLDTTLNQAYYVLKVIKIMYTLSELSNVNFLSRYLYLKG